MAVFYCREAVLAEIESLTADKARVKQMFHWHTIAEAVEAARKMLAEASKASQVMNNWN